jgi:SAM-dependent methyltransferase
MKTKRSSLIFVMFFLVGAFALQGILIDPQASAAWAAEKKPRAPDTHFIATPHEVVEIMIRLADVKKTDVLYDLGSGDGRIVIAAAKKAGCRAYGFDLDSRLVEISRANAKKERVESLATFEQKDFFDLDLSRVTVVTLYLFPELNVALIPKLEQMKPGSRVVTHDYGIEGIDPDVTAYIHRKDGRNYKIYLYTIPFRTSSTPVLQQWFGKDKKKP